MREHQKNNDDFKGWRDVLNDDRSGATPRDAIQDEKTFQEWQQVLNTPPARPDAPQRDSEQDERLFQEWQRVLNMSPEERRQHARRFKDVLRHASHTPENPAQNQPIESPYFRKPASRGK